MRLPPDTPRLLRVEIREHPVEKITLTPFMTGDMLCFQLVILSPGAFDQDLLDQHLAQIAFSAAVNQGRSLKPGDKLKIVPEWIWLGYCRYQSPSPVISYLHQIRPIYETRKIPGIDRILLADSPSQLGLPTPVWESFLWLVFRSVYLGKDGPGNIMKMAVEDLSGRDPASALSKIMDFPSHGELQKWWTLQVTHFCENLITEPLDIVATEKKLAGILIFKLPAEGELSLEETFVRYRSSPEIVEQLREKTAALGVLFADSPPEYQPVILRYQRLFQSLQQDPSTPMTRELEELSRLRSALLEKHEKRIDHMNWFIVTQTGPDRREFRRIFRIYEDIDDTNLQREFIALPPLEAIREPQR